MVRLTGRVNKHDIDELNNQNSYDLEMHEAVIECPAVIVGRQLAHVGIEKVNAREGIAFIDCEFLGRANLIPRRSGGAIAFTNCVFKGDLQIHRLKSQHPVELNRCRIDGALIIDSVSASLLSLCDVDANEIVIRFYDGKDSFKEIVFENVQVQKPMYLANVTGLEKIRIVRSIIPEMHFSLIKMENNSLWVVEQSRVDYVNLDACSLGDESMLIFRNCDIDRLRSHITLLSTARFDLTKSVLRVGAEIDTEGALEGEVRIAEASISSLELDDVLIRSAKEEFEKSPLFKNQNIDLRIKTVKKLKRMFFDNHNFHEEDWFFYLQKNLETKRDLMLARRMRSARLWGKFIKSIILRRGFGWGVKITDPIIAFLGLLMTFSVIYFLLALAQRINLHTTFMGERGFNSQVQRLALFAC